MRLCISPAALSVTIFALVTLLDVPNVRAVDCGDFELHPSPTVLGETSILTAARGLTPSDVWAVGTAVGGSRSTALHWDGSVWTQTPTPNPSATANDLRGVAAFATDDVWAVGGRNPAAGSVVPFVLHWDGDEWSIDNGPPGHEDGAFLWSAKVVGQDLWAVGERVQGAPGPLTATLAARRHGGSWETFASPNIADRTNRFLAVDGTSPDDVWAVGAGRSVGGTYRILLAHWQGSTWESVAVPTPGGNDFLRGVSTIASNDVWAVGEWFHSSEGVQPLLMHWNGSGWLRYPLAVFAEGAAYLEDVVAIATDDVWAVGTHATDAGVPRPLILHWNGSIWEQVPGAAGLAYEWFRGVAEVGPCEVWAVGQYFDGTQTANLTEQLVSRATSVPTSPLEPGFEFRVFPNPVFDQAIAHFALSEAAEVRLSVHSADGRLLRGLSAGQRNAGSSNIIWDRRDANGQRVPPGVYFLRMQAGRAERSAKLIVR